MRQQHSQYSLGTLCALFGLTRQAFYEAAEQERRTSIAHMIVLTLVKETRGSMPLLGGRKLLHLLSPAFEEHGIKMGRDQLFDLLRFHGLLIRRRKCMQRTTDSNHWFRRYPNLIKGLLITGPEQLWVSDITYIRTMQGFSYLSLITDAYSRKIVGFALHPTLEADGCVAALKMALATRRKEMPCDLIHHSDRGVQYCCTEYTDLLHEEGISISMTQSGSPYDNALAERVNGIIKNEFYSNKLYQNHKEAKKHITQSVATYNQQRPHASIDFMTPDQAHQWQGAIQKRWKHYRRSRKAIAVEEPV